MTEAGGYFVENEDSKLRTFLLSDDADISIIDPYGSPDPVAGKSVVDLENMEYLSTSFFRLDVTDGVIKKISEMYMQ